MDPVAAPDDSPVDATPAYRDVVLADGPVAYWRLGGVGQVARDEIGGLDGSIVGNCESGQGALAGDTDRAIRFDGATCRIEFPIDRFNFAGNAPFSVEVWVSLAQISRYQHFFTYQVRNDSDPIDGYALLSGPTGVYFERAKDLSNLTTERHPVAPNTFAYVVGVYDGSTVRVYVNGVLIGDPTSDTRSLRSFTATPLAGASPTGNEFGGVLDELAIYDKALSFDRIRVHHLLGRDGP